MSGSQERRFDGPMTLVSARLTASGSAIAALALLLRAASLAALPAIDGGPPDPVPGEPPIAPAESPDPLAAWQIDPETGGRYRIVEIPRTPARFLLLGDGRVRLPGGETGRLVRQDAETLWVRLEAVPPFTLVEPSPEAGSGPPGPADDLQPAPLPAVDRLELRPFDRGLPRSGQWRHAFDLADLDGDGHADLVSGPPRGAGAARPVVFLGDGRGGWREWAEARFPEVVYDYGTAVAGDLDGDGATDLVLAMHLRGIEALRGAGGGRFVRWSRGLAPAEGADEPFSSLAVRIADWDADGRPDLLAFGEGPRPPFAAASGSPSDSRGFAVFRNQGDGSWARIVPEQGALGADFGVGFALADLDRDGLQDVVAGSRRQGNRRIVGLRTADGALAAADLESLPPLALAETVAAADLDRDGWVDVAVGYRRLASDGWRSGIVVELGGPAGGRRTLHLAEVASPAGVRSLAVGDLDGDGAPDLAAGTGEGEIWLLLGDGAGGFAREASPELPPGREGCAVYSLRLADLDREAGDEIVAAYASDANASKLRRPDRSGCPGQGSLRAWRPVFRGGLVESGPG